jgi:hypothetical protein
MVRLIALIASTALIALTPAEAAVPVYADVGVPNTDTYAFEKQGDGSLLISFVGAEASFRNRLGVIADGVDLGLGLSRRLSSKSTLGATRDYGFVADGASLVFYIDVQQTGLRFFSDPSLNADGMNHLFAANYAGGDTVGSRVFAAGRYVALGFEDLRDGGDMDYDDARFVVADVWDAEPAPEPATWAMMLAGFAMVGGAARRRQRSARKQD